MIELVLALVGLDGFFASRSIWVLLCLLSFGALGSGLAVVVLVRLCYILALFLLRRG